MLEETRMPLLEYGWWEAPQLKPRPITLWLPERATAPLCVLFAHDGQNLFRPETSFAGVDWGLHQAVQSLMDQGLARPTMIVGLGNTPDRLKEYEPGPLANAYLRFLIEDLRPHLQERFPMSLDPADHYLIGSSMGGIISTYALCKWPEQFGGAACLSTHWPHNHGHMVPWLNHNLVHAGRHRWYFDYGDQTADAPYGPFQKQVDDIFRQRGYRQGHDWETLSFPGTDHSERSWRARVHIPLKFLLF